MPAEYFGSFPYKADSNKDFEGRCLVEENQFRDARFQMNASMPSRECFCLVLIVFGRRRVLMYHQSSPPTLMHP